LGTAKEITWAAAGEKLLNVYRKTITEKQGAIAAQVCGKE
jgi:hypothetical protein